jgi:Complex I intermediate-associated protein 30 (CIA30)
VRVHTVTDAASAIITVLLFALQPKDMAQANEFQYQTSFDTVAGQWITVDLPFKTFVAVRRNDVIFSAPKVNAGPAGTQMSR